MSKTKPKSNVKPTSKPLPYVVELCDPRNNTWLEVDECASEAEAKANAERSARTTGLQYRFKPR